ncbi:helix-turn-helix transcriptional regulator [Acidithiobacillus concretivorus]|uniref:WYL domain-containing protein n=1 Tax=Acidithiobacillus concretivorus TaxID=3063952 RepID=A0ABS5ZMH5_9PROT|nr:WYL domain-containing protein [Acidithiobacillus concretivorus]MBU2737690.1 WYL domain-containing protein [Acidithiobacillus concretivorus]
MTHSRSSGLETALLLLEILRRIPRKRFITAKQIKTSLDAAGFERDLRSVQRYLDTISQHFDIECDTRSKPYGYRWPVHARGFTLPLLSPAEALLVHLAESELHDILPADLLRDLNPLLEHAQQQIDCEPEAQPVRQWIRKVRRIPTTLPLLPAKIAPNILETVSNALYREQKLYLHYHNVHGEQKEATVWPLGLAQQGNRLYLVCRYEGYDNERILALPRIEKAELLPQQFIYPKDFDLARYDGEGRFAFGEGKKVRISFTIEKAAGWHLTESRLSEDQEIEVQGDWLQVRATVTDSMLLHTWLAGMESLICDIEINEISG